MMGNRVFDEDAWQNLIKYATMRKRGKEHLEDVIVQVMAEVIERSEDE